jgi:hypothetical protein
MREDYNLFVNSNLVKWPGADWNWRALQSDQCLIKFLLV